MIQIIIFSYNRAMQLDALLRSIIARWKRPQYKISILYNISSELYQHGYNKLMTNYPTIEFIKEDMKTCCYPLENYFSFFNLKKIAKYPSVRSPKSNFRYLLNQIVGETECEYIMFLTDDSVFIRDVLIKDAIFEAIIRNYKLQSISLRMGIEMNTPPSTIKLENGLIQWSFDSYRSYKNWGYPFSVDGHIYSKKIIYELISKIIFTSPSTLEAHLCDYVKKKNLLVNCTSFEYPFLLSFPLNMVQTIVNNKSLGVSTETLNKYFLDGYELNYILPSPVLEFQQYPRSIELEKDNITKILKI